MSEREGSRVTLWFPNDTRDQVKALGKLLDERCPKGADERTKGKRSWWTESESVRWAVEQALAQAGRLP
jgi:hypothetical protein